MSATDSRAYYLRGFTASGTVNGFKLNANHPVSELALLLLANPQLYA
jgi:hypothetical protein